MTIYTRAPQLDKQDAHRWFLGRIGDHDVSKTLNDIMDLDSVVMITDTGSVIDGVYPWQHPEIHDDVMSQPDGSQGVQWTLIGRSGQQGGGQHMHNSEFIGGGLADEILGQSGYYVAIVCSWSPGCPVCGDKPDYCQGHGEIGDPAGFKTLERHDNGDHEGCIDGCEESISEGWAVAYRPLATS